MEARDDLGAVQVKDEGDFKIQKNGSIRIETGNSLFAVELFPQ